MSRVLTLAALVGAALPFLASARSVALPQPDLQPAALVYSSDGALLLSLASDGQRCIVDPSTGRWSFVDGRLSGSTRVGPVALAAKSGLAVGMREDKRLVRWSTAAPPPTTETESPRVLHTFREKARAVATDATGGTIAAIDGNGELVVYQGRTRAPSIWSDGPGLPFETPRRADQHWPTSVAVGPQGRVAAGFQTGGVRLFRSSHPWPEGSGEAVTALAFAPDSVHLVAARGTAVTLYRIAENRSGGPSLQEVRSWETPQAVNRLVVTAGATHVVHLFGDLIYRNLSEHPAWVAELAAEGKVSGRSIGANVYGSRVLALSRDGAQLVTNENRFDLAVYELATGEKVRVISGKRSSPDAPPSVDAPAGWLGK